MAGLGVGPAIILFPMADDPQRLWAQRPAPRSCVIDPQVPVRPNLVNGIGVCVFARQVHQRGGIERVAAQIALDQGGFGRIHGPDHQFGEAGPLGGEAHGFEESLELAEHGGLGETLRPGANKSAVRHASYYTGSGYALGGSGGRAEGRTEWQPPRPELLLLIRWRGIAGNFRG